MHQKKSEVQVGKDSVGVSSDFTPLVPHHLLNHPAPPPSALPAAVDASAEGGNNLLQIQIQSPNSASNPAGHGVHPHLLLSAPHKRPVMNSSLSHSKTLHSLPAVSHPHPSQVAPSGAAHRQPYYRQLRHLPCAAASTTRTALRHLLRLRLRLGVRLRLLLLLSFPSLYLFLGSGGGAAGGRSPLYDFLSALAFSSVVLLLLFVSVNLLSLPSVRLLLSRSSSFLLPRYHPRQARGRSPPPVLWSIGYGGKPKVEKHQPTSGSWVQVYSNGDVYEGEFLREKFSGSGVYYYYMSGRYEGDWVDGKYDGYGVETWARGSRYQGQYRQGLRHGYGIYRFNTGDAYSGEWSNGHSHGCGLHTFEDGSRYVGEYKWGVKHGLGHYHFRNRDTYAGEYFADKMHGFGVYRYANGQRYEGAWHEGKKQGLGMFIFPSGETQSGHWQNGVIDILSTQSTSSCSPTAVYHSKVLNTVQEARRAAEKALDVPRVDDRVNKAVAAANKAANAARDAAVKAAQKQTPSNADDDIP